MQQDDAGSAPMLGSVAGDLRNGAPFGEELLFEKADAGALSPDEQRSLANRSRERKRKIAGWCEENARLRAEITSLREAIRRLADQDATLSVQGGNVTVDIDAALTDAEREAVDTAIDLLNGVEDVSAGASGRADAAAATLRGLLERLK
jgi:hypothetical protein